MYGYGRRRRREFRFSHAYSDRHSPPPPPPPPSGSSGDTKFDTRGEASRFLSVAGFGGDSDELDALQNTTAERWLENEFGKPFENYLDQTIAQKLTYNGSDRQYRSHSTVFWQNMIDGDDPLRHRMTYALSQIVVASDKALGNHPEMMAFYMDALGRNAFGNYRDLLEEVTYTPAMGSYLTYINNTKADEATGRMPDENFAREILQLFSIGTVELNMDGTAKIGPGGQPIESYTNDDVTGLARVFTGLAFQKGPSGEKLDDRDHLPLAMNASGHSDLEKSFLGSTIPPNTGGTASIEQALDIIFEHPNVAPYISRQLIQRFTASNPEAAYVERVATAFETGSFTAPDGTVFGRTGRGDLEATLAAILLDESQFDDPLVPSDLTDHGKVREPVLSFVHWARAFDVTPPDVSIEDFLVFGTGDKVRRLGQQPFNSISVFNFYRPGYIPKGSDAGEQQLTVPEMQLVNGTTRDGYVNFMTTFALGESNKRAGEDETNFDPDYSNILPFVEDSAAMSDYLNELLLYGRMTAQTRTNIHELMAEVPIRTDTSENTQKDRLKRAQLAVLLAVTSPEYSVQQ